MKRIHTETLGDKTARVFRDSDWGEFRVRLYIDGKLNAGADYHTGDEADAIATAAAMVQPTVRRGIPVSVAFNIAVLHIAGKVLPCGFDVVDSLDCRASGLEFAPHTFDSLMAHYQVTGRVLVWNGASDNAIFADREVNYAFQAWHNSKYILGSFPFTPQGEQAALNAQRADIRAIYDGATADRFCSLIALESFSGHIDEYKPAIPGKWFGRYGDGGE